MQKARLRASGRITLPKTLRDAHGWREGIEFVLFEKNGGISLKPINPYSGTTLDQLIGCVGHKDPKKMDSR